MRCKEYLSDVRFRACPRNPRLAGDALASLKQGLDGALRTIVGEVVKDQELSSCDMIVLEMTIKRAV